MEKWKKDIIACISNLQESISKEELKESIIYPNSKEEEVENFIQYLENRDVISIKNDQISFNVKGDYVLGTFRGNEKGFGFLITFDDRKDFYVYHKNVRGAIDGDIVLGRITRPKLGDRLAEVRIDDIVVEGESKYIGTFYDNGVNGYVMLDNPRVPDPIFISSKSRNGAEDRQKVFVKIEMRRSKTKGIKGSILEVLGHEGDVGLDVLTLVRSKNIEVDFMPETIKEAERIPDEIPEEEFKRRLDLRDEFIFTIDGEDAKDLDDAVSIEKLNNGNYLLGVHIADVSHFVKEGSFLDQDAIERATSVYLVDRVIPMLPPKLSNGVCSLHPNVDRLALSCIMEINHNGKVVQHDIKESVIRSKKRLTYDEVRDMLEGDKSVIDRNLEVFPKVQIMDELCSILTRKRRERGSIDFDFEESKVKLDENNVPVEIEKLERSQANKLIEEFMIVTNETVSEFFTKKEIPFVYRVHEKPDPLKIASFHNFAQLFGVYFDPEHYNPKTFQGILNDIKDKNGELAIQYMMLRSMKKAFYSPENKGHFGLASEYYSHFTSPIRRYPDLQIHRIIKEYLAGGLSKKRKSQLEKIIKESSEHSSEQELNAINAERESIQLKKAEFMQDKIGEVYEGVITGITEFGIYVTLENTVEGLIHISKLQDDYYIFDEETLSLVGERTGRRYLLGEKLMVKVSSVNLQRREIDFNLFEEEIA